MPKNISLTFLGTCSGGGPLPGRACSSACLNLDGELWIIDCAEGTQMQMTRCGLKSTRVAKIFVTHLHVDHCLGIVPLLVTIMYGLIPVTDPNQLRLELFGPVGLRLLLRTTLKITGATLSGRYAAHELIPHGKEPSCPCEPGDLHPNEAPGRDITCDEQGQWKAFEKSRNGVVIDAGPLIHRVPCVGYVFTELPSPGSFTEEDHFGPLERNSVALAALGIRNPRALLGKLQSAQEEVTLPDGFVLRPPPLSGPGRKIVILGDTCDSSGVEDLAIDANILVHEATNAYVRPTAPADVLSEVERLAIKAKAISRGHSTAEMAGEFAKKIGAKGLYLNHFSAKYPDVGEVPTNEKQTESYQRRALVIKTIEQQATDAWGLGLAVAASDFLTVDI